MNPYLRRVRMEYEEKQLRNRRDRDLRRQAAFKRCPPLEELQAQRKQLLFAPLPLGDDAAFTSSVQDRQRKLQDIDAKTQKLLASLDLPADALNLRPDCPHCQDTGEVEEGGVRSACNCFRRRLSQCALEHIGQGALRDATFENFDFTVFDDTPSPQGRSQRETMQLVKKSCEAYCDRFGQTSVPHILFMGSTGLGKSYLCSCIAHRLQRSGKSVLYIPAYQLIRSIVQRFDSEDTVDILQAMESMDCIVLDDLGTEPLYNNVTVETLFSLINERLRQARPIVLSTNLKMADIKLRYGERMASRLMDTTLFNHVHLSGRDIRLHKGR